MDWGESGAFVGFTSQTFDDLFSDIAALLDPTTARHVIRYHFRMKFLDGRMGSAVAAMEGERDDLLRKIESLQAKRLPRLLKRLLNSSKKCM